MMADSASEVIPGSRSPQVSRTPNNPNPSGLADAERKQLFPKGLFSLKRSFRDTEEKSDGTKGTGFS